MNQRSQLNTLSSEEENTMSKLNSAFISGAGGFIGKVLVRQLIDEGVSVLALVMPQEPVPADWEGHVRTVVGDVRTLSTLADEIGPVNVISTSPPSSVIGVASKSTSISPFTAQSKQSTWP
jgi:nucleoside-diphosphate-sugar epimerase